MSFTRILVCLISYAVIWIAPTLSAEETTPATTQKFEPVVPGNCKISDQQAYLTLSNGLKVLLLSKADAKKTNIALDVNVGSREDPPEMPGMAHFFEHMLFQGTQSHPDHDAWRKFLSSHGGDGNASTRYAATNYYYDIEPKFLEQSLAMFGEQFREPLLSEEFIDKEKQVINAEFSYRKDNDYRKLFSVAKAAFFNDHPFTHFDIGNEASFRLFDKPTLANKMRTWWQQNYSADKMSLVIHGPNSLADMERMVRTHFAGISRLASADEPKSYPPLSLKNSLPRLAKAYLNDEERAMLLLFPISKIADDDKLAAVAFIKHLLERSIPNSYVSALKGYDYASEIHVDESSDAEEIALLEIYIDLHYQGGEKYWEVIKQLMYYVDKLKGAPLEQWQIDEFNRINSLHWCYGLDIDASRYAHNLNTAATEHVFSKDFVAQAYQPEIYRQLLESIAVENMLVVVAHPHFGGGKKTPWFEVPYNEEQLSESRRKGFKPDSETKFYIDRPEPNLYLPAEVASLDDSVAEQAIRLQTSKNFEAWYARNSVHQDARAFYYVQLTSEVIGDSKRNSALTDILRSILADNLKYTLASAEDAGSSVSISRIPNGLGLSFEGYSQSIDLLLDKVLHEFSDLKMRNDIFDGYRWGWINYLKDFEKIQPLTQAKEIKANLLRGPAYSFSEQQMGMRATTKSNMAKLLREWKDSLSVTSLSYGNVREDSAKMWNQKVADALLRKDSSNFKHSTLVLPEQISRVISESEYDDSVAVLYVQGVDISYSERSKFLLLDKILSENFFSKLRSEQQLGYVIKAESERYNRVPGFQFYIQSPYSSANSLEEDILKFLVEFPNTLKAMPDQKFAEYQTLLRDEQMQEAAELDTEVSRVWNAILHESGNFQYRQSLAEAVSATTKAEFVDWFEQRFTQKQRRVLSILVEGNSHKIPSSWRRETSKSEIDDFEDFVENQGRFY